MRMSRWCTISKWLSMHAFAADDDDDGDDDVDEEDDEEKSGFYALNRRLCNPFIH